MMERRQIVAAARAAAASPPETTRVLVTLIQVKGSSYRQPGARLLTAGTSSQAYAGTISGGCLEAEVVRKAAWKVRGGPMVERFSMLYDDTADIPFGLGCGGTVDLLHEMAGSPEYNALMYALDASLNGESFTVITWLPGKGQTFARAVLAADGGVDFATEGLAPFQIAKALVSGTHWGPEIGGVHVERLDPPQRLIVFGAGDDAKPLVRMAAQLGWTVNVVDGRQQLARPERFPEAQYVVVASAGDAASLGVSGQDAVVLMTHSYEQDREWLAALLPIAPRYFGVLGAKHRSSLLVSEASAMSGLSLATCCERIFAPVGLDLGGDGPESIALAIISEAHARCMGKLGSSLRLSVADVSAQVRSGSKTPHISAPCPVAVNQVH